MKSRLKIIYWLVCFALGLGWPLSIYYFGAYYRIKMESETYVRFFAKKQAVADFQSGRFVLYTTPIELPNVNTNFHKAITNLKYTNDSLFPEVFVQSYNQRMIELMEQQEPELSR